MAKPKILLQLDADPQPSVFDAVVAIDAGAEQLLRHGGVTAESVRDLIYGGMFTRSPADLHSTAVVVGGSSVAAAEAIVERIRETFFGPLRMSVLMDAAGCNTTAAAAVLCAGRHVPLAQTTALVLGGTGPVGQRVARLLVRAGATVRVGSRQLDRAAEVCRRLDEQVPGCQASPHATGDEAALQAALQGVELVVAAGAPGVTLLDAYVRLSCRTLRVAVDLNAVPPAGIVGIKPPDHAEDLEGVVAYGAVGVGGLKMKIHKAAIRQLFMSNDQMLDAEEVFDLGRQIES